jgi:tripartite-type tricarboxylate transporter receptor subunit TctC
MMANRRAIPIATGALLALATGAFADDYPSHPITILVPFPPGGSADTVVRPVAQKVADNMKATIVIRISWWCRPTAR